MIKSAKTRSSKSVSDNRITTRDKEVNISVHGFLPPHDIPMIVKYVNSTFPDDIPA